MRLLFLIACLVCLALLAFNIAIGARVNLWALAALFYVAAQLPLYP